MIDLYRLLDFDMDEFSSFSPNGYEACIDLMPADWVEPTIEQTREIPATPLEDDYIWVWANKWRIIGQTAPVMGKGRGSNDPNVFEFILPDSYAVEFLNRMCVRLGVPERTLHQWRKWLKSMAFDPPKAPLDIWKPRKQRLVVTRRKLPKV